MNIPKEQWQKWASEYAAQSVDDFCANVHMSIAAQVILKAKMEQAYLCGVETAATMVENGAETKSAHDLHATLMRSGDNTYKMKLVETDGGEPRLVHETDLPDYPRDGSE